MFKGNQQYIYLYMYVCIVFSMIHSRARLRIILTARRIGHFMQAVVALTYAADSTIEINNREGGNGKEKSKTG